MVSVSDFDMGTSLHWRTMGGDNGTPWILVPEPDVAALTDEEIGAMVRSLAREARRTEAEAAISWLELVSIANAPETYIAQYYALIEEFADEPFFVPWVVALGAELARTARREARRIKDGGRYRKRPIPKELRLRVLERDNYTCQICGATDHLHADHIMPEIEDGPTTLENLRALCSSCNSRKGAR